MGGDERWTVWPGRERAWSAVGARPCRGEGAWAWMVFGCAELRRKGVEGRGAV